MPDVTVSNGQIVFGSEGLGVTVETKAAEVTSLSSFYVTAVTGSAGSESSVWNSVEFSQVPGSSPATYTGNKYWPVSADPGYKFYGSNVALNFAADGTYVNASNATDVVCSYLSSPTYKQKNTLNFEHIFARLGTVTIAAIPGYTLSEIDIKVTPNIGGRYNIRTGSGQTDDTGWSDLTVGSAIVIGSVTGANVNSLWLVPGNYTLTASWSSTDLGGNTIIHNNKIAEVSLMKGAVNNISLALGGDISVGIDISEFVDNECVQDLEPLTFEALGDGNILWKTSGDSWKKNIEYSKDNGVTWVTIESTMSGAAIPVNSGDKVLIKGNNKSYSDGSAYCYFSGDVEYYAYGNITDLLPIGYKSRLEPYCFSRLFNNNSFLRFHETKELLLPSLVLSLNSYQNMFSNCTGLTTAPQLPATTLARYCYNYMFSGCTGLTTAPELPATSLADYCYYYMFSGCTSLTTAPGLPATSLAKYCYYNMFNNCSSLTTAPELPATSLADYCYYSMFNNCSSLTTAPELPATSLAMDCYAYMFSYCSSLTTAPELPATSLTDECYNHMFYNCTSLTTAPELPATSLARYCYYYMFYWCTSLTESPELSVTEAPYYSFAYMFYHCSGLITAGDINADSFGDYACYYMFTGCTNLTTSPEISVHNIGQYGCAYMFSECTGLITASNINASIVGNYSCEYMFNGCTSLTTAPELPATSLANYCYYYMFNNCSSLTTAPELPATSLAKYCYGEMFMRCSSLTTAPELPATVLAEGCYQEMFSYCSNLTTAPQLLPADILARYCYQYMFYNCTSLTTAPELPALTLQSNCYNYMFTNCSNLSYIKALFTTTPSSSYTSSWVSSVASTGVFVKNESASWTTTGGNGIPTNWTVQTSSVPVQVGKFNGREIAPCNLMYDGEKYVIPYDDWNHNDNTLYGEIEGSYHFTFYQLRSYFTSLGVSYNGHNDWRIPTKAEFSYIIEGPRAGSTVNGVAGVKYVGVSDKGLLVFPDGCSITGAELTNVNSKEQYNELSDEEIVSYINQGCVFYPNVLHYRNGSWTGGNYYWCSDENPSALGYMGGTPQYMVYTYQIGNPVGLHYGQINEDNKNFYYSVRLVRTAD